MIIVKIGGGAEINHKAIARGLAGLKEGFVVVHGANALRDRIADTLNHPLHRISSLSGQTSVLSDEETIDLQMMCYAGLRNKRIVELFQQHGINAVGLSGVDGRMVEGRRNPGIRTMREGKKMIVRDYSGKPASVNIELLRLLLDHGYAPVLSVPIIDENGFAINSENDDIVALLQWALKADRVLHLIEAPGLLEDHEDPDTVVPSLTPDDLKMWEDRVEGRMKRKLHSLRKLYENGSPCVHIGDGRIDRAVELALSGEGTVIE